MSEKVFCLVPSRACVLAEPSVLQQDVVTEASRELQAFLLVVEDAVAGVVYDEEIVWSVVGANEIVDVAIELVLGLLPDVELDNAGGVVEALAEQARELSGLCLVRPDTGVFPSTPLDMYVPRPPSSARRAHPPT